MKGPVGQMVQNDKSQLCAVEQNKVVLPPNYGRHVAWGFADRSLRIGTADTDKVTDCSRCTINNHAQISTSRIIAVSVRLYPLFLIIGQSSMHVTECRIFKHLKTAAPNFFPFEKLTEMGAELK